MTQDEIKKTVAQTALNYIEDDMIVGVGTGSTVDYFIEALAAIKSRIEGAVSSSKRSTELLKKHHIPVFELNSVSQLPVYIDGADECDPHRRLIKGGGGALTQEKIVATVAEKFICIVDNTKCVDVLGQFPLAIEVIPCARSYVARQLVNLGGDPVYRQGFITDNGNIILDVHNLKITNPIHLEQALNNIVGIVCHGLFAKRPADTLLIGAKDGVQANT